MRRALSPLLLLPLALLAGCEVTGPQAAIGLVAVTAVSVAAIQRTPIDAAYSMITGKDCSVVRLDQGKTYCRPTEPPPDAPPYCTRSLGQVDCWQTPAALPNRPPEVADGPRDLTPAQEADRTRRWPGW